jgi:hypothetical protein
MIYSKWGNAIRITGYCGNQKVEGFDAPMMLIRAIRLEDGAERYYLATTLKADNGIYEVHEAIAEAPEVVLGKAELKAAINQIKQTM